MVFVEHQNAKQKLAAKAAESQAAAAGSQEEAALPAGAANAEQGAPPIAQGATTLVQGEATVAEEASPKNVCGLVKRPVVPHFAQLQSDKTGKYQGQSVVHQFLESGTANLEFVWKCYYNKDDGIRINMLHKTESLFWITDTQSHTHTLRKGYYITLFDSASLILKIKVSHKIKIKCSTQTSKCFRFCSVIYN